jgi:hypothetical protein
MSRTWWLQDLFFHNGLCRLLLLSHKTAVMNPASLSVHQKVSDVFQRNTVTLVIADVAYERVLVHLFVTVQGSLDLNPLVYYVNASLVLMFFFSTVPFSWFRAAFFSTRLAVWSSRRLVHLFHVRRAVTMSKKGEKITISETAPISASERAQLDNIYAKMGDRIKEAGMDELILLRFVRGTLLPPSMHISYAC